MNKLIKELIKDLGGCDYKRGVDWKGYKVYIPQYEGNPCIGLPYVVLKKGEDIRISTPEESLDYLDCEREKKDEK